MVESFVKKAIKAIDVWMEKKGYSPETEKWYSFEQGKMIVRADGMDSEGYRHEVEVRVHDKIETFYLKDTISLDEADINLFMDGRMKG